MSRRKMLVFAVIALTASVAFGLNSVGAAPATTQKGAIGLDVHSNLAGGGTDDWGIVASLKSPAKTTITDADVAVYDNQAPAGVVASDESDAACAGTFDNPTAPNDKVCVYISNGDNAVDVHGVSIVPGIGGSKQGFKIVWSTPTDDADSFIEAVWAYRHPG